MAASPTPNLDAWLEKPQETPTPALDAWLGGGQAPAASPAAPTAPAYKRSLAGEALADVGRAVPQAIEGLGGTLQALPEVAAATGEALVKAPFAPQLRQEAAGQALRALQMTPLPADDLQLRGLPVQPEVGIEINRPLAQIPQIADAPAKPEPPAPFSLVPPEVRDFRIGVDSANGLSQAGRALSEAGRLALETPALERDPAILSPFSPEAKALPGGQQARNALQWLAGNVPSQTVQIAEQIALSKGLGALGKVGQFAGFAAPNLILEGGGAWQETYDRVLKETGDEAQARRQAALVAAAKGGVSTALEALPFEAMLGGLKAKGLGGRALAGLKGAAGEVPTEMLQEGAGAAIDYAAGDEKALDNAGRRMLEAGAIALLPGAAGGVIAGGGEAETAPQPRPAPQAPPQPLAIGLPRADGSVINTLIPNAAVKPAAPGQARPGRALEALGVIQPPQPPPIPASALQMPQTPLDAPVLVPQPDRRAIRVPQPIQAAGRQSLNVQGEQNAPAPAAQGAVVEPQNLAQNPEREKAQELPAVVAGDQPRQPALSARQPLVALSGGGSEAPQALPAAPAPSPELTPPPVPAAQSPLTPAPAGATPKPADVPSAQTVSGGVAPQAAPPAVPLPSQEAPSNAGLPLPGNPPATAPAPGGLRGALQRLERSAARRFAGVGGGDLDPRVDRITQDPQGAARLGPAWRAGQKLAEIFGKRVVAVKAHGRLDRFNGAADDVDPNLLFFNTTTPVQNAPALFVIGHEVTHQIERDLEAGGGEGLAAFEAYRAAHRAAFDPDRLSRLLAREARIAQVDLAAMSEQEREEFTQDVLREHRADFTGEQLVDPGFWQRLAQHSPGVFRRTARAFIRVIDQIKAALKISPSYQAQKWLRESRVEELRERLAGMLSAYQRQGGRLETPLTRAPRQKSGYGNLSLANMQNSTLATRIIDAGGMTRELASDLKAMGAFEGLPPYRARKLAPEEGGPVDWDDVAEALAGHPESFGGFRSVDGYGRPDDPNEVRQWIADSLNAKVSTGKYAVRQAARQESQEERRYADEEAYDAYQKQFMSEAEREAEEERAAIREEGEREEYQPAEEGEGDLPFQRRREASQTDTPEFKRWFGDSKVVDAEGNPLVVYHGTGGDFTVFDPALSNSKSNTGAPEGTFFFSDKTDVANSYTVGWQGNWTHELVDNANVMPVYLSIKRPLKVNAKGENWNDILYKGEYRDINEIAAMAKQSGRYDGVIVSRVRDKGVGNIDSKQSTTYIAFSPTQIKSATGNSGAFDPANPDIRFQRRRAAAGDFFGMERGEAEKPNQPNPKGGDRNEGNDEGQAQGGQGRLLTGKGAVQEAPDLARIMESRQAEAPRGQSPVRGQGELFRPEFGQAEAREEKAKPGRDLKGQGTLFQERREGEGPQSWGITRADAEAMLERMYRLSGDYYDSRKEFMDRPAADIAMEVESEYELYNRYLRNLPEDVTATDVIEAYRAGTLPLSRPKAAASEGVEIPREMPFAPMGGMGEPRPLRMSDEDLRAAYAQAAAKATKTNEAQVLSARHAVLIAHNSDADLPARLGIGKAELNKKIRSWSNESAQAAQLQERLNRGKPATAWWTGISNSNFLSRRTVSPADVDAFVRGVKAGERSGWNTPDGDGLRGYIVRAFMAIDTRILYKDLAFVVDSALKPLGRYSPSKRLITIRANSPHTVAHEIGHYLDHKWGQEAYEGSSNAASTLSDTLRPGVITEATSPERERWVKAFGQFVMDISERSDIGSAYLQDRGEVFARFVSKFVDWANEKAGMRTWGDQNYRADRFQEGDYLRFIALLQQKAVVDQNDGNPLGKKDLAAWEGRPVEEETWEKTSDIRFQARRPDTDELGFYSKLERVIEEKMPERAHALQIRGMVEKGGVKAEEMRWSGLDEWLKENTRPSKEEVLGFLRENNVEVREVVKDDGQMDLPEFTTADTLDGVAVYRDGKKVKEFDNQYQADQWIEDEKADLLNGQDAGSRVTKFPQYQLPGGRNYKELLLTLPNNVDQSRYFELYNMSPSEMTQAEKTELEELGRKNQGQFHSGHFDEPNVLVHVRLNEREDEQGRRVLFIEEVQSDWHQKGRKAGYRGEQVSQITKLPDDAIVELRDGRYLVKIPSIMNKWIASGATREEAIREALDNINDREKERRERDGVPAAPFSKTWHELAFRRMVRYAAENGFDAIAWTTGDQQITRYEEELRQKVDRIEWRKDGKGGVRVAAQKGGRQTFNAQLPLEGYTRLNGKELDLEDIVGKKIAGDIRQASEAEGTVEGEGLAIGGDGMRTFYDQILPNYANSFGKKWGARVGTARLEVRNIGGERLPSGAFGSYQDVHSLPITPAMRESVLEEGVARFQDRRYGEDDGFEEPEAKGREPELKAKMVPAEAEDENAVFVKNAYTEAQRMVKGLEERTRPERRHDEQVLAEAKAIMEEDDQAGFDLVAELSRNPEKMLLDRDVMLLTLHGTALENRADALAQKMQAAAREGDQERAGDLRRQADEVQAQLAEFYEVSELNGTLAARAFRMRARGIRRDYTLARMRRDMVVATGGQELTPEQRALVESLNEKIRDLTEKLEAAEKRAAEQEREAAAAREMAKMKAEKQAAPRRGVSDYRNNRFVTRQRAEEVLPKFKQIDWGAFQIDPVGGTKFQARRGGAQFMARREAQQMDQREAAIEISLYHFEALKDRGAWEEAMVRAAGEAIRPHLPGLWRATQEEFRARERAEIAQRMKRAIEGKRRPETLRQQARALARSFVEDGIEEREALVDAVFAEMKAIAPGITREQAMDAISGYGQFRTLSKDEISETVRGLAGEMQQVGKLRDMLSGVAPKKTGFERRAPSDEERRLIAQVNEMKKQGGFEVTDPESQLRTALMAVKRRLQNQIDDLATQILERRKIVPVKSDVAYDLEAYELEAKRDALKNQFDEIFGKPELSDEQRAKRALKATERQIERYDEQIRSGKLFPERKAPPTSPELEAARARREALKAELKMLREAADEKDPSRKDAIALRALETRLAHEIADLKDKVARGDFAYKPRRETPTSEAVEKLRFERELALREWNEGLLKARLASRTKLQKALGGVGEVINAARSIITSFDLSAVLRQGGFTAIGHPLRALKLFPTMFKALRSERGKFETERAILEHKNYHLAKRAGLDLTDFGPSLSIAQMEEAYMSRWAKKIPGVGASQRAYSGYLNALRFDSFSAMVEAVLRREGKVDLEQARALASLINRATGRIGAGKNGAVLAGLSTFLWAPRLYASRIRMIPEILSGGLLPAALAPKGTRAVIAGEYARFIAGAAVIYALGAALGGDLEDDPLSSDFGKIRFGPTRVDPLAGLQQFTVFLARAYSGKVTDQGGLTIPIRGEDVPFAGRDAQDLAMRFLRSKLNPVAGTVWDFYAGEDFDGKTVTVSGEFGKLIPMAPRDIYEALLAQGLPKGTALGLLSVLGAGVSTYEERPDLKARTLVKEYEFLRQVKRRTPEQERRMRQIRPKALEVGRMLDDAQKAEKAGREGAGARMRQRAEARAERGEQGAE